MRWSILQVLLVPIQAPMLLVLVAVSTHLGMHWSRPLERGDSNLTAFSSLVWSAECVQALVVIMICTMPELLISQVSTIVAKSRTISLVLTLLFVTILGLYLLNIEALANVLILGSAVLLARLDLVRIRLIPPPPVVFLSISVVVLGGVSFGRLLTK
jgi:hypothetical protein